MANLIGLCIKKAGVILSLIPLFQGLRTATHAMDEQQTPRCYMQIPQTHSKLKCLK